MNLLELANRLLTGTVAKAEVPPEDPDKPTPGATGKEELEAARQEAASGQQAQADAAGPEGEGGAPPTGAEGAAGEEGAAGAEGAGAPPKPEEEESPVEKAEILKSMQFLAEQYGITSEEVAKAFTGLEGDPSAGKEPLGKGVEYLEGLLKKQGDILERIASFLQELSAHTVKMGDQVAKSLEAGGCPGIGQRHRRQGRSLAQDRPGQGSQGRQCRGDRRQGGDHGRRQYPETQRPGPLQNGPGPQVPSHPAGHGPGKPGFSRHRRKLNPSSP